MSLISDSTKSEFTEILQSHFDTFKRQIVIFKEPLKVLNSTSDNPYPGYGGETSNSQNYTYIPVSGIFYGRIRHEGEKGKQDEPPLRELNIRIPKGGCIIKLESDAKDFLLNGKTEMILADGKVFNLVSDVGIQNYLGLQFYLFTLEGTP